MQVEAGTRKGQTARAPTTQEWADIMGTLHLAVQRRWGSPVDDAHADTNPIYIFDNASVHDRERLYYDPVYAIPRSCLDIKIPAHSPDFNKVAEHIHARLEHGLMVAMYKDQTVRTAEQCITLLKDLFLSITTEEIERDTLSLMSTFQAVLDADGGYPGRQHR